MGIRFTDRQQRVVDARGHNILVSAAAGSGKTAVLTARIVEMVSDSRHPVDIDRLLVVTFTRAAAAEMRDRIGKALAARLALDPENRHLQAQETLLQRTQITTIDSFCNYVLRNHFSVIDLDPGFRVMDQTEAELLRADVMDAFLEEMYGEGGTAFTDCAAYFCPEGDDSDLGAMIRDLLTRAESQPVPERWLRQHREDYACETVEQLEQSAWMAGWLDSLSETADRIRAAYDTMLELCALPGGPHPYMDFLRQEKEELFAGYRDGRPEGTEAMLKALRILSGHSFARMPAFQARRYPEVDAGLRERVKDLRAGAKDTVSGLTVGIPEEILEEMRIAEGPVRTLFDLTLAYRDRLAAAKKEKNIIDFADLEHYALQILTEETEDGQLVPSATARAYRQHYQEILIDEYQDSNEVQEVLLKAVSGEDEGRYDRFMVGDVKQSIYRFRLARPEIFMDKFARYKPGDDVLERIDLDRNFRSRDQVLRSVNAVFARIMRAEIGGIDYTDEVSLKTGASGYAMPETEEDPYRTELLLVCTEEEGQPNSASAGQADGEDGNVAEDDPAAISNRQKEAAVIAARIREMVGHFPLSDGNGGLRPATYGDIVILLRSAAQWNEDFKEVLEKQGIPVHVESRTGFLGAQEILALMQLLRVLLNPRQDLYLYGVLHGYFGGMTEEETAVIRAACPEGELYDALLSYASGGQDRGLAGRCTRLLDTLAGWRERVPFLTVSGLLTEIMEQTGYDTYCAALPAGEQRSANLELLLEQAESYDRMGYTGLFRFLRFIDSIRDREIDLGEANTLDEKADVVRIMTIHKSKGLEFPICIVAGLAKKHSYLSKDSKGALLTDSDWGVGADLVDTELRTRRGTVRKQAIEQKIMRDSLGEELRVLYVAMTRAKEKLILSMQIKTPEKTLDKWENAARAAADSMAAGHSDQEEQAFPASWIMGCGSFGELVCGAVSVITGCSLQELGTEGSPLFTSALWPMSALRTAREEENESLHVRRQMLESAERMAETGEEPASGLSPEDGLPHESGLLYDPGLAARLREKLERRYAREDLEGLFVKTSVSELKHAAMERLAQEIAGDDGAASEGAAEWFGTSNEPAYVPSFARTQEEGEAAPRSAVAYGTAVHRFLECVDLSRREELCDAGLEAHIRELTDRGLLEPYQAEVLPVGRLRRFLRSGLARRMAAAESSGFLYREQPFVLGIAADRLRDTLPADETVMIQGIIDVYFREGDHLVLADYKTDRVSTGGELAARYRTQIDYYTEALERITGLPVRERILYSFALGEEVPV